MEKTFSTFFLIPCGTKICEICPKIADTNCDKCRKRTKQTKNINAKIIILKRKPTIEYGRMLHYFVSEEMRNEFL